MSGAAALLPDRSAFVRYAVAGHEAAQTMADYWRHVDAISAKRWQLRHEGNSAADLEIARAASAAYARLRGE